MFVLYEGRYGLLSLPYFILFFLWFCFFSHSCIFCCWLCCISSCVSCYVCHFLWLDFLSFTQFLLLTLSVVHCFFSSCFFILVFTHILLYKRIWTFVGQIVFTRSEGIRPNWLYSTKVILSKNCILQQICILLQITFLAFLS